MRGMTASRTGSATFVLALAALLAVPAFADETDVQRRIEERFTKAGLDHETDIAIEVVDGNTAVLQFGGGCQGCGMVDVTLKQGVEKTLVDKIPELVAVRDVTDHTQNENAYYR